MRDIPIFATENGVASLVLREIPYRKAAYVRIQDTASPKEFIGECADFCRAAGADKVYATGSPALKSYPLHTSVCRMQGTVSEVGETDCAVFPVTDETLPLFCRLYNEKMASVPTASYMRVSDGEKRIKDAYFVHKANELLGIGIAAGDKVEAIAACIKGKGRDVLAALCRVLSGEQVVLEVAENNLPAMDLYARCGFVKTGELTCWYEIL